MTTQPEPGFAPRGDPVGSGREGAATESEGDSSGQERVVVVTPEGMAITGPSNTETNPATLIEQPAKVMRIGSMIKQLLEEVRSAPLDEAGRVRLAGIHERSLKELEKGLAPELVDELRAIALPFDDSTTPSDAELRIAQAQLVGWLEGLFHGIQTVLFAQQMAARTQLEQIRRALPGGPPPGMGTPEGPQGGFAQGGPTGQYL
jgi:hypothetical protein